MQSSKLPWHSIDETGVLKALNTTIPEGLSWAEAKDRLKKFGLNEPPKKDGFRLLRAISLQVTSPLALVLLITGIVAGALGATVDAIVILVALSVNVALGVFQEGQASKIYEALEKSHAQHATVERSGTRHTIKTQQVVPGDVVHMVGGDKIPADIRLIRSSDLHVNEASLTGEWEPVSKDPDPLPEKTFLPDRINMLWSGTTVTSGFGKGIVVATGAETQLGHLAYESQHTKTQKTPLQIGVGKLARTIVIIISAILVFMVLLGLAQGRALFEIALISIAVAVSAVPEGLPAAVSIVLAVGMKKILAKGGLVKSLLATETLGSTTVILTDKTGTLTEGNMSVTHFYSCRNLEDGEDTSIDHPDNLDLLEMATISSDAFVEIEEGKKLVRGRPIERAIMAAAIKYDIIQKDLFSQGNARRAMLQFEPLRRYAASLNEHPKDGMRVYLTGSPEHLVKASTHCSVAGGSRRMNKELRSEFIKRQDEQSSLGDALVAVAYKRVEGMQIPEDVMQGGKHLKDLVFVGLIVLSDAIRPDVQKEIRAAQEAGVRVVMVTGDHAETARAVAVETGIGTREDSVITGAELAEIDEAGVGALVMNEHIFARVTPEQKLRIVHALSNMGQVVAMTGDGVNDAPALNAASVGVALGSGTDVAKESADIILLNNSFSTITDAIREGRRIVDNLGKVVAYLLSTGLSEVLIILGALIAGVALPLLPTQLLWTNIIHEGLMSTPFAFEPANPDLMKRRPRGLGQRVLTPELTRFLLSVSIMGAALFLSFYLILYMFNVELTHMRTLIFAALSLSALSTAISFKNSHQQIWHIPILSNPALIYSLIGSMGILVLTLSLPFTRSILSLSVLGLIDIGILILFAIANICLVETIKWVLRVRFPIAVNSN